MADERPWDDATDQFVSELEGMTMQQYSVNLRTLLMQPKKYANTKDISQKITGIRKTVSDYFSNILSSLKDEQDKLDHELESANMQYEKINELIGTKSASRVPYIKPSAVNLGDGAQEEIVINGYDSSTDLLLSRLLSVSNYVADISDKYKDYTLGSWVFSGQKTYLLTINQPTSAVIAVENGRDVISDLLDDAADALAPAE